MTIQKKPRIDYEAAFKLLVMCWGLPEGDSDRGVGSKVRHAEFGRFFVLINDYLAAHGDIGPKA